MNRERSVTADLPGDRNAVIADAELADFVVEHYERLLRLARLVVDDASEAGDAVQFGLEKAWRHRTSLRDPSRRKPWLDRIVVREAIRVSKARRSWIRRLLRAPTRQEWLELPDPLGEGTAARSAMREAFATLSAEHRAVVSLHLHSGYTVAETAAIVGVPLETVRSRLRVAKEKLRHELREEER
jgi:RNA polymerase sigma-70 factor (ECF subfamily)